MFTAMNASPFSLLPTVHKNAIILSCKWIQQVLPKLHVVISKKTITLIELSDDATVH
jgi:hypothetical protein